MHRSRTFLALAPFLVVAVALPAAAPLRAASQDHRLDALGRAIESAAPYRGALLTPKDHTCVLQGIQCGQTVTSNLTTHDCAIDNGTFVDFYRFEGTSGDRVTVDLSSNAFDAFLFLLDPTPTVVAVDDDSGPGANARIVHVLDQSSPEWTIAVNSFAPATGPYTLTLACEPQTQPPPPPDDGYFSDPAYPDFRFRVRIGNPGSTKPGTREAGCQPETVCVSGAVPGRSELFVRIIGPRPNGFLWPTLVRFSPSRIVVDIRQVSTGQNNQYTLQAVPPGTNELPGLQDRIGFLP